MSQPFDAMMKQLLDQYAIDWIEWLAPRVGLPAETEVEPFESDLSSIKATADKVFRLKPPGEGYLLIEPQSYWDSQLPNRLHFYASQILHNYGGPVYTIAILLRPLANSPAITGVFEDWHSDGSLYLHFRYLPIRVWELSAETLINGPLGSAPLALLTNEASSRLKEYVTRLDERLEAEESSVEDRRQILVATFLLMGMRYTHAETLNVFTGVKSMRESSTYMAILEEGEQKGRLEERRVAIIELLEDRFGTVPSDVQERIQAIADMAHLKALLLQTVHIASLNELEFG